MVSARQVGEEGLRQELHRQAAAGPVCPCDLVLLHPFHLVLCTNWGSPEERAPAEHMHLCIWGSGGSVVWIGRHRCSTNCRGLGAAFRCDVSGCCSPGYPTLGILGALCLDKQTSELLVLMGQVPASCKSGQRSCDPPRRGREPRTLLPNVINAWRMSHSSNIMAVRGCWDGDWWRGQHEGLRVRAAACAIARSMGGRVWAGTLPTVTCRDALDQQRHIVDTVL